MFTGSGDGEIQTADHYDMQFARKVRIDHSGRGCGLQSLILALT